MEIDLCPDEGHRRGGALHGQRPSLRSEQFKPHIGDPSPGVQPREHEPPSLVGRQLGLTGGLWEDWSPLWRSMCVDLLPV